MVSILYFRLYRMTHTYESCRWVRNYWKIFFQCGDLFVPARSDKALSDFCPPSNNLFSITFHCFHFRILQHRQLKLNFNMEVLGDLLRYAKQCPSSAQACVYRKPGSGQRFLQYAFFIAGSAWWFGAIMEAATSSWFFSTFTQGCEEDTSSTGQTGSSFLWVLDLHKLLHGLMDFTSILHANVHEGCHAVLFMKRVHEACHEFESFTVRVMNLSSWSMSSILPCLRSVWWIWVPCSITQFRFSVDYLCRWRHVLVIIVFARLPSIMLACTLAMMRTSLTCRSLNASGTSRKILPSARRSARAVFWPPVAPLDFSSASRRFTTRSRYLNAMLS